MIYEVYTDGACSNNPGPGGWGFALIKDRTVIRSSSGYVQHTTNNQMEMTAVIKALSHFKSQSSIHLFTDSNYVIQGINSWIHNWLKRDWKTASNKPVKNVELWKQIDKLNKFHDVKWNWVKGHSGNFGNEIADKLATEAITNKC